MNHKLKCKENDENVNKNDQLFCNECGKEFKTMKALNTHLTNHQYFLDGKEEFCGRCNQNIPEKQFTTHLEMVHPNDEDFQVGNLLNFLYDQFFNREA